MFEKRKTIEQIEESTELAPKFDEDGLIPVITTEYESGLVLMQGYMNREALELTIKTGQAHYYSRSRRVIWHKGASSGLYQNLMEMLIDDDQDCVWLKVKVAGSGASCHVGYKSCFYRSVPFGKNFQENKNIELKFTENHKTFDPKEVYGDAANPTQI